MSILLLVIIVLVRFQLLLLKLLALQLLILVLLLDHLILLLLEELHRLLLGQVRVRIVLLVLWDSLLLTSLGGKWPFLRPNLFVWLFLVGEKRSVAVARDGFHLGLH
jgi:hypothetical protein